VEADKRGVGAGGWGLGTGCSGFLTIVDRVVRR
jgi:hypothetical protein